MPRPTLTRREALLRLAGGAAAPSLLLAACDVGWPRDGGGGPAGGGDAAFTLAPINLDPDRITRTYVCARPYRPSGFRVEAERMGETLLVHNYGHGGGGFTLSWGTAAMVADILRDAAVPAGAAVAVAGCGVVGLTTALVLLERGFSVTIHARALPPDTTSNLAGASFFPSTAVDPSLLTPAFAERLETACRTSHARFLDLLPDPRYGISWKPQYFVTDEWTPEIEAGDAIYGMLRDLYPNQELFREGTHPFQTRFAWREDNIFIEPTPYLTRLVADFRERGGNIVVRDFESLEDLLGLDERWIVNCTGLGASALVTDPELTSNPSQTVILAPQPDVDYAVADIDGVYMFPRSDGIMLGRGEGVVDTMELLEAQRRLVARTPVTG